MRKIKVLMFVICLLVLVGIPAAPAALGSQAAPDSPSAGLSIPWWTVDGGGVTSQGGAYSLSGSIGQHDSITMTGGNYSLRGGFWSGGFRYFIYVPFIER
jgi:hypothetical protein